MLHLVNEYWSLFVYTFQSDPSGMRTLSFFIMVLFLPTLLGILTFEEELWKVVGLNVLALMFPPLIYLMVAGISFCAMQRLSNFLVRRINGSTEKIVTSIYFVGELGLKYRAWRNK